MYIHICLKKGLKVKEKQKTTLICFSDRRYNRICFSDRRCNRFRVVSYCGRGIRFCMEFAEIWALNFQMIMILLSFHKN